MITVVSDTSPINYLILIDAIEVLPQLFEEVLIPPAVLEELQHARTPLAVRRWIEALPAWARVQAPLRAVPGIGLDPGETEAISLAVELNISAILIDERKGRFAAEERGLVPVGTLNILFTAHGRGLLDFPASVEKLRQTSFHLNPALIQVLQDRLGMGNS